MAKRGRVMYVPSIVIEEVHNIKQEHNLDYGSEAFRKMAEYSVVGREVERLATFNFFPKKKRGGAIKWL